MLGFALFIQIQIQIVRLEMPQPAICLGEQSDKWKIQSG